MISLRDLTLRQKGGQTCQTPAKPLAGLTQAQRRQWFSDHPLGSLFVGSEVIRRDNDPAGELQEFIAACQEASPIPLSIAGDLENGAGGAVRGLTAFPNLLALGAANDPAAAYEYGYWTAREARRIGFNWTFGPVVDLALNWLNPIVNLRCLGSGPARVAPLAAALIRGYQEHGLSATAKHFPGDGVDFRDQHLCVTVNSLDREAWHTSFGEVYRAAIDAGVHAVMAGHVALPWLDPTTGRGGRPIPATVSAPILTRLLRDDLGFDGVIVSDALIMAGFTGWAAYEERIVQAFEAGIDVMLWPGDHYFDVMERAIASGRISEERLDESVARILKMKAQQGILPPAAPPQEKEAAIVVSDSPAQFAQSLADQSVTLIRNDQELLPLDPAATKKLLLILATPRPAGAEQRIEPLLAGIRARGIEVELIVNGNCLDIARREEAGQRYDALLAVFELWTHGLKNTMRPTGEMAEVMWTIQMTETLSPIVVSLGSPYLLNDMPWAETFAHAAGNDRFTLAAVCKAVFGDIPFGGVSAVKPDGAWVTPHGQTAAPERASRA